MITIGLCPGTMFVRSERGYWTVKIVDQKLYEAQPCTKATLSRK